MKNLVVPMSQRHLKEVAQLSSELGYEVIEEDLFSRFNRLNGLDHHALFVFENDRGTLGFIHLESVDDLIEEKKIEIKALVVSEKERSLGIGSSLIQASIDWAKKCSVHTIYLNCNILRNRAHSFYEREGFKKVKTSHFFEMNI